MKEVILKSEKSKEDAILVSILKDKNSTSRERENAFNTLYSRNQKNLSHFFKMRVNNEDVAEDLKMISFEKAYSSLHTFDCKFAFSTWLYTIARNTLIDHYRKESRIPSINDLKNDETSDSDKFFKFNSNIRNPEEEIIINEGLQKIQNAIDSIKNEFMRKLVTYKFIYDLSSQEIADKMGIENNSTIRVNINRGREIIKNYLS
jgi:RNA polymerase sigma-70 factor, ECF subfamily